MKPTCRSFSGGWFWRGYRLLGLVSMMMDYMLPKRVMSWQEAWEMYFEEAGGALFEDLSRYGIRLPKYHEGPKNIPRRSRNSTVRAIRSATWWGKSPGSRGRPATSRSYRSNCPNRVCNFKPVKYVNLTIPGCIGPRTFSIASPPSRPTNSRSCATRRRCAPAFRKRLRACFRRRGRTGSTLSPHSRIGSIQSERARSSYTAATTGSFRSRRA
jgi:hypothetical protein